MPLMKRPLREAGDRPKSVIASQITVGGFADGDLSEAIQFLLPEDWIASSPSVFDDENRGSSQ